MHILRACALCSAGAAAVSFTFVCLRAAESQQAAAKAPDLLQRVAALEEKVAQLQKKLDQLPLGYLLQGPPTAAPPQSGPRVPNAPQAAPGVLLPATPPTPPGVPPNAVPREFNGQTYYIVPLGKEAAR